MYGIYAYIIFFTFLENDCILPLPLVLPQENFNSGRILCAQSKFLENKYMCFLNRNITQKREI